MIHAIRQLYCNNVCYVTLNNRKYMSFMSEAGVKQGCPLSMVLFSIALDPVIRLMCCSIGPDALLRAYCDDLALVANKLIAALRKVTACFLILKQVAALELSSSKIQCCLLHESRKNKIE